MGKISLTVRSLDVKIRQLALKFKTVKQELEKTKKQNKQLEAQVVSQKNKIDFLEKEIQVLTMGKVLSGGEDAAVAKKKINELLREIDTCIDFLNNKSQ